MAPPVRKIFSPKMRGIVIARRKLIADAGMHAGQPQGSDGAPLGKFLMKARRLAADPRYSAEKRSGFARIADFFLQNIKKEMPAYFEKYLSTRNLPVSRRLIKRVFSRYLYFDNAGNPKWGVYEKIYLRALRMRDKGKAVQAADVPQQPEGPQFEVPVPKAKKKGNGKKPRKKGRDKKAPLQAAEVPPLKLAMEKIVRENPPEAVEELRGLMENGKVTEKQVRGFATVGSYTLRSFRVALGLGLGRFGPTAVRSLAEIMLRIGPDGAHYEKIKKLVGGLEHGKKIYRSLVSSGLVLEGHAGGRDVYLAQPEHLHPSLKKPRS